MRPGDEVTVRRDDLRDAAAAVLQRVNRLPDGDLRLAPGETPDTIRVLSEFAESAIAAEGAWGSHVVLDGGWLWRLCQPGKAPTRLRLTYFGKTLVAGDAKIAVRLAWPDGADPPKGSPLAPGAGPVRLVGLKRRYHRP
jgi:hypothetical protein